MILKNVPIKICPNWAKGGRGKLNWDNVLQVVFFMASLNQEIVETISQNR